MFGLAQQFAYFPRMSLREVIGAIPVLRPTSSIKPANSLEQWMVIDIVWIMARKSLDGEPIGECLDCSLYAR
jgi:hypothetical protein